MRPLLRTAALLAALLLAHGARSQPKPVGDDADAEIPAAPPSPPAPQKAPPDGPALPPPPPALPAQPPRAAAASDSPSSAAPPSPEVEALRREVAEMQARMTALEAAPPPAPSTLSHFLPQGYSFFAFVQAQYERHQDSEDQIQQGGVYLNQDRFSIRHARARFDAAWQYTELSLEVDGSTTNGAAFGFRRAEASLVYRGREPWSGKVETRGPRDADTPPIKLTLGLTDIPYGFEMVDAVRDRVFMERSLGSLALFPSDADVGARLTGALGVLRYSLAVMNGVPIDDTPGSGKDPIGAKDVIARFGADTTPAHGLRIAGGLSILRGQGFHAGTPATANTLQWVDTNENEVVDPGEIVGVPGAAATPSATFARWAYGMDLRVHLRTALGETMAYGEATLAQNLDRGLFVADPVATGIDVREIVAYAALVQDVTEHGLIGIRYDVYNPNADFFDSRGGQLIPSSQTIQTVSPLVGLVLPGRARLLFQYDVVRDLLARDAQGVPTSSKDDRWTLRLQVQL
jgi:hypothetical protein